MDAQTRRESICELLREKKKIRVNEIAGMFGVSAVTINNDLNILESGGIIRKNYGYAEILDDFSSISSPNIKNYAEKKRIAKAAAGLMQNNISIAIYTGTTCLIFAREISPDLNLIVVTCSLPVAVEIGRKPRVNTILIGGDYNAPNFSTYGLMAVKQLESFNLDMLFMSVDGISADNGCTIDQYFEADINATLIRNAKKVVLMADYTKIGVTKFIKIADISDIDIIVTDDKIPEKEKEKLQHLGTEMIIV